MIEKTTVEIRILYDHTGVTDAVIMTKFYQALGFTIKDSETPKEGKGGNMGYYLMSFDCEGLDHHVFAMASRDSYPDFFKRWEKSKPLG